MATECLNTSLQTCARVGDLMACVLVRFSQPSQPCGDSFPFALANNHSGTSVYTGSYAHTRTPKAISLCYNPCTGCLRDPDKHLWFTSLFPFLLLRRSQRLQRGQLVAFMFALWTSEAITGAPSLVPRRTVLHARSEEKHSRLWTEA